MLGARKRIKKAPSVDDGAKRDDALGVVARICLRSKHIH
ncbi:hypothetical protein GAGA_2031 [Paraglaciecola agarilytica NO2]|uniref:Uncharacterized protein n=1 Tax=Paraglaciecola agarilytica NO2 TaxID=1125747 RepID=A0ABQ0I6B2_9ALTE|nr:hypothetical protein GAGA_2031 [Paraglaciecola agarilytica NO2]